MTADPPPTREPDADDLAEEYAGHVRSCAALGIRPLTPEEFRLVWRADDWMDPPSRPTWGGEGEAC